MYNTIDFSSFKEPLKHGFEKNLRFFLNRPDSKSISEPIHILFIGNCFQVSFLLPLLEAIKKYDKDNKNSFDRKIEIYTVKNLDSLELFERSTVEHKLLNKFEIEEDFFFEEKYSIKIVGYDQKGVNFYPRITRKEDYGKIINIDLDEEKESLSSKLSNLYENGIDSFDIIFCCFELHFCLNWRLSLVNLLKHLNKGGVFVFSEITDTLSLMDGNFIPKVSDAVEEGQLEKETFKIFKDISRERTKYHYWKPEISFSNYTETQNFLSPFFTKPIATIVGDNPESSDTGIQFDSEAIKAKLKQGDYSYFRIGLNEDEKNKLIKKLNIPEGWKDTLKYGIKLFFANGFNAEKLDKQKNISWNYSTFSKDIQSLNEFQKHELITKSLDIFASHDIIFPNHTTYTGIFSWRDNFSSSAEPIHLVINHKLFLNNFSKKYKKAKGFEKQFIEYKDKLQVRLDLIVNRLFAAEKAVGISLFDFAFNQAKIGFPIIFQNFEEGAYAELFNKNNFQDGRKYTLYEIDKKGSWLGYKMNFDKKGDIIQLRIAFSYPFGKNYLEIRGLRDYFIEREDDNEHSNHLDSAIHLKPYLSKIAFDYSKPSEYIPEEYNDDDDKKMRLVIDKIWQKTLANESTPVLNNKENSSKNLFKALKVLYNFQLRDSNQQFSIYPSKLSEKEISEELPNTESAKGLGGVFSYDKIIMPWKNRHEDKLELLMIARDKVLSQVSNLILYKAGLIDYVGSDFRKHIRRAAIAAISARNVSHNIGSHVIPNVTSSSSFKDKIDSRDVLDSEKIRTKLEAAIKEINYSNLLLDYLQHRNDFINHLTSGKPGWTISVWFVKNLLARFFRQYHLLNSIAAFEELSVFDYDNEIFTNYVEKNWFDSNFNESLKNYITGIIVYGYLNKDEKDNFYLTKNHSYNNKTSRIKRIKIRTFEEKKIEKRYKLQRGELIDILKKQVGRKFKVYGQLHHFEENGSYELIATDFIEHKIIIKVRKRKYLNARTGESLNISSIMGKEEYINLSKPNTQPNDLEYEFKSKNECEFAFGVIERIDYKNAVLHLVGIKPIVVSLNDTSRFDKNRMYLKEGTRIIISYTYVQYFQDSIEISADLVEIIEIESLVLPFKGAGATLREEDVLVSIPGGISGFQAFYTILENIIRNAAKHNWKYLPKQEKIGRNLEIKIEIEDLGNNDKLICKIWTNTANLDYINGIPEYENNHSLKSIKPLKYEEKLSAEINNKIVEDIIEGGEFSKENLGISEIKINTAYLQALKGEITDEENIKGQEILLRDKEGNTSLKGFLRASQIMEYEKGKIIQRLGYRLILQKPKDLIIISDNRARLLFDQLGWEEKIFNNHSIFLINNHENSHETLDYEYCLLFQENDLQENVCFANKICAYIDGFIDQNEKLVIDKSQFKKHLEEFDEISNRLEHYPFRTFLVLNNQNKINERRKLVTSIRSQRKELGDSVIYKTLIFLTDRIRFMNKEEITKWSKKDRTVNGDYYEWFKMYLYHLWVSIYEKNKLHKYNLQIELGNNQSKESLFFPGSVPPNLRVDKFDEEGSIPDTYNRLSKLNEKGIKNDVGEKAEKGKKTTKKNIKYSRHETARRGSEDIFLENLSGEKNSFLSFVNVPSDDIMRTKLQFQLYENGHANYLIIDERIAKFYNEIKKTDYLFNFLNCNIFVPHYFYYKLNRNPDKKIKFIDVKQNVKERIIQEGNVVWSNINRINETKVDINSCLQLRYFYFDSAPHITTLIIHQSILEKIIKDECKNEVDKKKIILDLIRDLKLKFPSVIITSGKNKSDHFSKGSKFLPFSVLEDLVMTRNPDKFLLTQILFKTLS